MRTDCRTELGPTSLLLCIRIPKSGSHSLMTMIATAPHERRVFYLPNTLDLDGRLNCFQHLRFRRTQIRNLYRHYGSANLGLIMRDIGRRAAFGDIISGGHIDFSSVRRQVGRDVKIVTLVRNPYDRCRSEYVYARSNYARRTALKRLDSSPIPRAAARYNFAGYVDFLFDRRNVYGDIAANYLGIPPTTSISEFVGRHVFHAGVLERCDHFADGLAEKLGFRVCGFPHTNRSGGAESIDVTLREKQKIETIYARDFEIYEYLLGSGSSSGRIKRRANMPSAAQ